jgi:acetoin utilization deacetylase AcuC-like enzyme
MIVFHSERHARHAPRTEMWGGWSRPHPEVPERVEAILAGLAGSYRVREPTEVGQDVLNRVHSGRYLKYLESACRRLGPSAQSFPSVFPRHRAPRNRLARRGYYCYDTYTPLCRGTFDAAASSAACALAGARHVARRGETAYCLCRPPGHHASSEMMAGYCYLNNAAVAAADAGGRVAILDIDSHHGNGTQEIFFRSKEVLTCSIHGDPGSTYPFSWGSERESGEGPGAGFNVNLPLPGSSTGRKWLASLGELVDEVRKFEPDLLIVPMGLDGLSGDRVGAFRLSTGDYSEAGRMIAGTGLPACIVQEGGYCLPGIGAATAGFLEPFP